MRTTIGQFILLVAVLADLFTMVLLTIYGGINGEGGGSIWLSAILIVFTAIFYLLGSVFKRLNFYATLNGWYNTNWYTGHFALIILLVALAEGVGAEYILGAFSWCSCITVKT